MNRYVRGVLVALVLVGPGAAWGTAAQSTPSLTVRDAWIRQPMGERTAGFLTVVNTGPDRAIVSASCRCAATVELHEMKQEGGMMRMAQVPRISVPQGGSVELKPGGLHLMFFGLKSALDSGTRVPVTLAMDDGTKLVVEAEVRRPDGMKP